MKHTSIVLYYSMKIPSGHYQTKTPYYLSYLLLEYPKIENEWKDFSRSFISMNFKYIIINVYNLI